MSLNRSHHCIYDTHYHVVFPMKYRKALLDEKVCIAIREIAKEIELRYEIALEELGSDINHIHILCSFHPKLSGGDFVRIFKSITAKELFRRFPELRKELWGGEFWADGTTLPPYQTVETGRRSNNTLNIKERQRRKRSFVCSNEAHAFRRHTLWLCRKVVD